MSGTPHRTKSYRRLTERLVRRIWRSPDQREAPVKAEQIRVGAPHGHTGRHPDGQVRDLLLDHLQEEPQIGPADATVIPDRNVLDDGGEPPVRRSSI
jgi:hypothetical protein